MMSKWSTGGQPYMGEHFDNCYLLYTKSRDADLLSQSNWRSIIKYLDEKKAIYSIIGASHWLCGYIDQILISPDNQESVDIGNQITKKLSEYPVFDDDDYSDLESEKAHEMLQEIRKDIENLEPGKKLYWGDHIVPTITDDEIIEIIYNYGMVTE